MLRFAAAAAAALLVLPTLAWAEEPDDTEIAKVEPPSPEAIQSFWAYYFKGKGNGAAVGDLKLCLEVAKEGENKNECVKEVPPEGVKTGTVVILWQAYLVPQGETENTLSVQVKHGDTVRETKDVLLKGDSIRMRNWTHVRLSRPGTWTLSLIRNGQQLKSFTVQAQ